MATITPGTGGTIQSPLLEGQFMQLVEYFQSIEVTAGNVSSYFQATYDTDTLLFSGTFNVPLKLVLPGLNFIGNTVDFLVTTGFAPGTGGTFTAPTAIDYFLQVLARILAAQIELPTSSSNASNVTATINVNRLSLSGTFSLPFTKSPTGTGLTLTPVTYLP
jgi:hypothetical protein